MAPTQNGNCTHINGNGVAISRSGISVKINGNSYDVDTSQVPLGTSLNSFLRNHANLPGTKFMCLEGGCGACIVTATGRDPVTKEIKSWAVNSCLTPIYSCDNLEITTVEGIGNRKIGYHPIQKRLTQFHGTQCGYCSPGMVMNMHSLMEANNGQVTMKEVENSFGGNICRCTGYRPILDAFKSLASDADPKYKALCPDIEDIPKKCPRTGEACSGTCAGGAAYEQQQLHLTFRDGKEWYKPLNLDELFSIWSQIGRKQYMLVAGNTAHGVYRTEDTVEVFIDVKNIADLRKHSVSGKEVVLGGNVSLTDTMAILTEAAKTKGFEYCDEIVRHIDLVANVPVRNAGTIAGNLSIKHDHNEFPSDIFLVLMACNAKLTIANKPGSSDTIRMEDYLKTDMFKKVILNIVLPSLPADRFVFRSYKIMPRAQNAHAYVNAAFLLEMDKSTVKSANICFGGINPGFFHATKTEKSIIGNDLYSPKILHQAIETLQQELYADSVPPDASPAYRNNLAVSLFYKFVLATCPSGKIKASLKSGGVVFDRPVSTAVQSFDTNKDRWPITQPVEKLEGLIQASGEAQYANDIPNFPGQLWAAFVPATEVHATVVKIDPAAALNVPGVRHFFSAKDIPGKNNFTPVTAMMVKEPEEIFCADVVKFHGQPLGVILADSFELANSAARLVEAEYQRTDKDVIPTIFDAYEKNAVDRFKELPFKIDPTSEATETKTSVKGRFEIGGQYHFTMETHTTVCVPTEDCMDIYSSTQWTDLVQMSVAQCLAVPESSLNIQVRRLGGGYGSKISRPPLIACACALGAKLTNRPVRFVMSLESNMAVIGKRHAMVSDYEVYVDAQGKIRKLVDEFAHDYGWSINEDTGINTIEFIKNCYASDTWKVTAKLAITDAPSHTWCRAPGTTEGIAIIENIMEHIGQATGLDPTDVRMANIPEDSKMKTLLPEFLQSIEYRSRKAAADEFNRENRWRKRGIAVVPMHYPQGYFGSIPVLVSIFHTDGTVAITHGGVECGQGINTKVVQIAAKTLGIPMDYIKIKPSLNSVTANSVCTGGSMTSEAVCFGTMKACEMLLERMQPVRETMKSAKWTELTEACAGKLIELTALYHYKATDLQNYSTWGLSAAEVEVDVLTGNFHLRRVDILEDTGESISPHVDLGQVEGAFIMGLGYWLTESLVYDRNGELLTNRSWNYKPPGPKDIPLDFRVSFLRNSPNPLSVLRSKATGEPSLCMSIVCIFALRNAIRSARLDAGLKDTWINLGAPTTAEKVFLSCGTDPQKFSL